MSISLKALKIIEDISQGTNPTFPEGVRITKKELKYLALRDKAYTPYQKRVRLIKRKAQDNQTRSY